MKSIEDWRPSNGRFGHVTKDGLGTKPGTLVQVRPCDEKYGEKTYVGIFVGYAPLGLINLGTNEKTEFVFDRNPLILIPETNSLVFGCESWWSEIQSEEQLRQITDEDIENVWYVKLLRERLSDLKAEA